MTRLSIFFAAIALPLVAAACSKPSDQAPAPAQRAADAAPAADASAIAPAASAAASGAGGAWSGHYTSAPGPFSVPDGGEWSGVKFRGEDAGVGLGEGSIALEIDPGGHAQGTIEGPLGPLRATGELLSGAFSAALVSAEPSRGFSGFAVGKADGDRITGTMRLSLPTGNVIRLATFELQRKH